MKKNIARKMLSSLPLLCAALVLEAAEAGVEEWPWLEGPNHDSSYRMPEGLEPAIQTKQMQQMWDSALQVAAPALSRQEMPNGGCATPIIHDGRMYIWWVSPDPDAAYSRLHSSPRKARGEFLQNRHMYRVIDWALWGQENIACIDLESGKTLWWRTFESFSPIYGEHKESINAHSMAAAEGKVFAKGSDYQLYCLDAESGALLWRQPGLGIESRKAKHLHALSSMIRIKDSRQDCNSLAVANGVLIDSFYGVAGYDINTGKRLWKHSDVKMVTRQNAKIFPDQGREYVIVPGAKQLTLIDPLSGEELWRITDKMGNAKCSVQGDLVFVSHDNGTKPSEGNSGMTACYRISPEKAEFLWENPEVPFGNARNHVAYVHGEHVFLDSGPFLNVLSLKDGALQKKIDLKHAKGNTGITMRVNDFVYCSPDSQHLNYNFQVIDLNKQEAVGQLSMLHPAISYSAHMLPVFHGDSLYLRRSYGRISRYRFTNDVAPETKVDLDKPIYVAAVDEEMTLTASVTGPDVDAVHFLVDGKKVAEDTSAPFEYAVSFSTPGTRVLQAVGIQGTKQTPSFTRLMDVVEIDLRLLTLSEDLRLNEKRRVIPVAFRKGTDWPLPQKFQTVRFSGFLSDSFLPLRNVKPEDDAGWRNRVTFTSSSGKIVDLTPDGDQTKRPYSGWGTYVPSETGTHTITVTYEHGGRAYTASTDLTVLPEDAPRSQKLWKIGAPAVASSGRRLPLSPIADTGWLKKTNPYEIEVLEGANLLASFKKSAMRIDVKDGATGRLRLRVRHPGNADFAPTDWEDVEVFVCSNLKNRAEQVIHFNEIPDQKAVKDNQLGLQADSESEFPVQFSVLSGPAKIEEGTLILTGEPGRVTVIAEHPGDHKHHAALAVVHEFRVN